MAAPAMPIMATENQVPSWKPNKSAAKIATTARMPTHRKMAPRKEKSFRVQNTIAVSAAEPIKVTTAALSITPPPAYDCAI